MLRFSDLHDEPLARIHEALRADLRAVNKGEELLTRARVMNRRIEQRVRRVLERDRGDESHESC